MHPLRKAIVMLCLLLLLIGAFIQPVQAQSSDADEQPKSVFFWRVSGNFEKNQLNLQWIVTEAPGGSMVKATDVIIIDISEPCNIGPGVEIYDNAAHFPGKPKAFITCALPNFAETVKDYLGPVMAEDCQCNLNTVAAPFAAARFAVPTGSGKMPLFAWSNLRLFATEQQTLLQVGDHVFESNLVGEGETPSTFIGLGASAILHYLVKLNGPLYWLAHSELTNAAKNPENFVIAWLKGGSPSTAPAQEFKYELDPNEQMLYIGFDPVTGTTFEGELFQYAGDPGCRGYGNS